jgi:hypothetical protein
MATHSGLSSGDLALQIREHPYKRRRNCWPHGRCLFPHTAKIADAVQRIDIGPTGGRRRIHTDSSSSLCTRTHTL